LHNDIRLNIFAMVIALGFAATFLPPGTAWAQPPSAAANDTTSESAESGAPTNVEPADGVAEDELQRLAAEAAANRNLPAMPETDSKRSSLNGLDLLLQGGPLMIPIGLMSLLVVAVALERLIALRKARLYPRGLRRELRRVSEESGVFNPQELFHASEKYSSAAARILRDMLLKVGRPIPEAESAIAGGMQREADHLYGNVRWLTLAAAVTPLMGLLGTVWGMILAFQRTTELGAGRNKAEFLAEGIYIALITTLGGLAVAIPAAIFAHYFEGRITKMLAIIETELRRLIPRMESAEGKTRYDIRPQGLVRRELPAGEPPRRPTAKDSVVPPPTPPPSVRPAARQN
jgi:biopolymer transport protein ExbB